MQNSINRSLFRYSTVVILNNTLPTHQPAMVYPSITSNKATLVTLDPALLGTDAWLIDNRGNILQRVRITMTNRVIDLSARLGGLYFIRLANNEVLKMIMR